MELICIDCLNKFEAKRKDTLRCPVCKKKRRSYQVMVSRKKKFPNIELGVGSGNSTKNKNQPLGIQTYRRAKKDKCE